MDKEVLEVVLKRTTRESNIHRILELTSESALPKGENYTSIINRIRLKVILGSGRIVSRSLIVKNANTGESGRILSEDLDLYGTEAKIYSVILKEMEFLMEEFEEHDDPLWCKFIYYDSHSSILVLEDLKAIGFKLLERQIGMDLEHALLVLRNLGRYHAMAKMLEIRGLISKEDFKPHCFLTNPSYIKRLIYLGVNSISEGIRKYWGPKWQNLAEKLSISLEKFIVKLKACAEIEGTFTCLNHGDCWSNNMMFRYDWQNRPVSQRFLDYQISHYNTPCIDVSYFIHMSIQPHLRRQNYRVLLQCYHQSLTRSLDRYDYTGYKPSLEEIEKVMEQVSFFGLSCFAAFYPVLTSASKDALDIEKCFETEGEEGFNLEIYKEEGLIERVGEDLNDYAEMVSAP